MASAASKIASLWRNLFRRKRVERDLEAEVHAHVEMLVEEKIAAGMNEKQALRAARIELGGIDQVKEQVREVRMGARVEELWQDVRYGLRMLRKNPGFTAMAVLTLALGIGANTAIFSLMDAVLWRPLPVNKPEQLVAPYSTKPQAAGYNSTSYADYEYWRDHAQSFAGLAVWARVPVKWRNGDQLEQLGAELVSGNFFSVLGLNAARGRMLSSNDDQSSAAPVAVISHRLWQQRFNGDSALIGRTLNLSGQDFTVIGVAPANFSSIGLDWGKQPDVWVPLSRQPQVLPTTVDMLRNRDARWLLVIGRLKDDVKFAQAEAELKTLAAQLAAAYPQSNATRSVVLLPLSQAQFWPEYRQETVRLLMMLEVIVAMVLLIACFNVANLLLARAAARQKEVSIRLALGAGPIRLIRQWLTESALLALLGAGAGLLVAVWLMDLLTTVQLPFKIPLAFELHLDHRALGFTLLATFATVLIIGLAPALQASKSDLVSTLKQGSDASHHGGKFGLSKLLVIAQVALSLVLLLGAGLLARSLWHVRSIDPGFNPERVLLVRLQLDTREYTAEKRVAFYQQLLDRVRAQPEIEAASLTKNVPLNRVRLTPRAMEAGDAAPRREGDQIKADPDYISSGYFQTLGMRLLGGREFSAQDDASAPAVAIINQALARQLWPNQDPLGRRIKISGEKSDCTVIGVAPDVKYRSLLEPFQPYLYLPASQHYIDEITLQARTSGEPFGLVTMVRQAVKETGHNVFISELTTINDEVNLALSQPRLAATFSGALGLLALALAAMGLYSVVAYSVSRRTREIGIRMALGARQRDVLRLVVRQGMILVLIGVIIGLMGALALTRLMSSLLFGVSATDPATFTVISLLLACYLPARRATKVDPMVALRCE